ncbi:uncharacterized protein PF3D7_1120000-like [Onthophagus taurus]|uniref:uncharacterized protein PF3D7_1120000-like n=1 Tax=Onthophagus taurus TaxID=166361 RepID=UPI0039BDF16F
MSEERVTRGRTLAKEKTRDRGTSEETSIIVATTSSGDRKGKSEDRILMEFLKQMQENVNENQRKNKERAAQDKKEMMDNFNEKAEERQRIAEERAEQKADERQRIAEERAEQRTEQNKREIIELLKNNQQLTDEKLNEYKSEVNHKIEETKLELQNSLKSLYENQVGIDEKIKKIEENQNCTEAKFESLNELNFKLNRDINEIQTKVQKVDIQQENISKELVEIKEQISLHQDKIHKIEYYTTSLEGKIDNETTNLKSSLENYKGEEKLKLELLENELKKLKRVGININNIDQNKINPYLKPEMWPRFKGSSDKLQPMTYLNNIIRLKKFLIPKLY